MNGSASTPAGVLLEVRTARLANVTNRLPKGGYVSAGFFTLNAGDSNTAIVPLPVGSYALQYRWVKGSDRQTSRWRSLGKATVGLDLAAGSVDAETGEVMAPVAKPARMKRVT